jgi:hypothetical protein
MEHAKVNGVELADEVVGSGEADAAHPRRAPRRRAAAAGGGTGARALPADPLPPAGSRREHPPGRGGADQRCRAGQGRRRAPRPRRSGSRARGGALPGWSDRLGARGPAPHQGGVAGAPGTGASHDAFGRALAPLTARYEAGDVEGAVHGFLALVGDRNWRATVEQTVPGGIAQAVKDAATFFETEVPGVPEWTFGPKQAGAITCPVLSVLGSNSSPLFVQSRQLLHAWFPACQDADIAGATHLLQMQAPAPVAAAIAAFL